MTALGISAPEIRLHPRNILVEAPADWVYLLTFAQLLANVPDELMDVSAGWVHIRPCGGTEGMKLCVPSFLQDGIKSVMVLDSDQAGDKLVERLQKTLGLPNEYVPGLIRISEFDGAFDMLGEGEHEIEDLFGKEYYARLVTAWLGGNRQISASDFNGRTKIGNQVQGLVSQRFNVDFRKGMVAWKFREIMLKEGIESVPPETTNAFVALLKRSVKALAL